MLPIFMQLSFFFDWGEDMNELEENMIREYNYKENFARMRAVKRHMLTCRIFNVYVNIGIFVICFIMMLTWYANIGSSAKVEIETNGSMAQVLFPGAAVCAFLTPAIIIMSFCADVYLVRVLNKISQVFYLVITAFALSNLILMYEPMVIRDLVLLLVYGLVGFWTEDFAVRSYKELDELSKYEGFPDFNYLIEKDRHSKYVKYRNKWLNKQKNLDYYSTNEKPVENYNVSAPNADGHMDGISIEQAVSEGWFDNKTEAELYESLNIDSLEIDDENKLDDKDYEVDDPRRRPL